MFCWALFMLSQGLFRLFADWPTRRLGFTRSWEGAQPRQTPAGQRDVPGYGIMLNNKDGGVGWGWQPAGCRRDCMAGEGCSGFPALHHPSQTRAPNSSLQVYYETNRKQLHAHPHELCTVLPLPQNLLSEAAADEGSNSAIMLSAVCWPLDTQESCACWGNSTLNPMVPSYGQKLLQSH